MVFQVRVKAGNKFQKIEKDDLGNWIIKIKAPPVDGKANEELIQLLSKKLHLAKSSIQIISGRTSQLKRIRIESINDQDVLQKLLA